MRIKSSVSEKRREKTVSTVQRPVIGLVGLGHMGSVMARHFIAADWEVVGWDRDPDAIERFSASGGTAAESIAEVAVAPVVISIVFDDDSTREVAFGTNGLIEALPPGGIHVVMASISPALAQELDIAHSAQGSQLLAASVFGRPEAAETSDLLINCSGPASAYAEVEPLLSLLGTSRWIGDEPAQAMLVKTMGNSLIQTTVEMLREMFQFLKAGGIDEQLAKEVLVDTLFPGPIYTGYAQHYIADPSSAAMIDMARKDRRNCLEAAEEMGVNLPVIRFLSENDLP